MPALLAVVAVVVSLLACALPAPALATVSFHPFFTDGIVLQRDTTVAVYGTASPGEAVTVDFRTQSKATVADGSGNWRVDLDPMAAGGPDALQATGPGNSASVGDVMVGEVWVCAGQSNMVLGQIHQPEFDADPLLRWRRFADFFVEGPGEICWRFGQQLRANLGVPVMLINIARSGSQIRQWLPASANTPVPDPAVPGIISTYKSWGELYPSAQFIQPYTIRAIAWWQGESDRSDGLDHQHMLPALIRSWRQEWGQGDIPFIVVQLPTGNGMRPYAALRRLPNLGGRFLTRAEMAQAFFLAAHELPEVSMVVTSDLPGGTHPPEESRPRYWRRFAMAARHNVYGEAIDWSGPMLESMASEGDALRLHFRAGTATGMTGLNEGEPVDTIQGFAISNDGQNWFWAQAVVEGETIVLSSPSVPAPNRARYGWGKRARWANLFSVVSEDPDEYWAAAATFQAQLP